jgi:MFS family permease
MHEMTRRTAWLERTLEGYRTVLQNPRLRSLELAWGAAITAEWAHFVALGVFAYQTNGAFGVGLVGFIRLLPAAGIAPFAASLGDHFRRERFLGGVCLLGAAALAGSAAAYAWGPNATAIYMLAAVAAIASTLFRPAHQALLPSLATTPDELVAANAVSSTLESLGTFAGPILGGILIATADAGWVFAGASTMYAAATVLVSRIYVEGSRLRAAGTGAGGHHALVGFRVIASEPGPRLVIGLMVAQTFVRGALNVLIVVVAFRVLNAGAGWVGFLTAAVGAGGLLGAFAAIGIAGRRLARPFALALILWGIPIALLAGSSYGALALALVGVIGAANSLEDVAGFTLLQRIVDDDVLTRVLGALWGLAMAGLAAGSISASLLIAAVGEHAALIATGCVLPIVTLLSWSRLTDLDRTAVAPAELDRISAVPMFEPLPVATKEQLARRLVELEVPAGVEVITVGAEGDRFYLVGEGEIEVLVPGRPPRRGGPGDYFGEIALLRNVLRTATVRTLTPCVLYALARDHFLTALTGHEAGRAAGERIVADRLAEPVATG